MASSPVLEWMGATVRDLGLALGGMFSFWHGKRVGSLVQTNKQAGVVVVVVVVVVFFSELRMWLAAWLSSTAGYAKQWLLCLLGCGYKHHLDMQR